MDLSIPPTVDTLVREDFARFIAQSDYPCLGARAALRRGGCRVGVYGPMTGEHTTAMLAADLATFAAELTSVASGQAEFVSFVAIFLDAAPESELAFESALWRQLTLLSGSDPSTHWADGASDDPEDPHFAFSFANGAFFVVGLHPESSRLARRLSWPALVFNPHVQFQRLRTEQRFEGLRRAIRDRDTAMQGNINPNLSDQGERSEARQYSGRPTDESWRCPFHRANE